MTIRKFFAATAVAGAFVLAAGAGSAFADDAHTDGTLASGTQVCISVPTTADPVRAEGLGDSGVVFTLTSEGTLFASNAGSLSATINGAPGAVQLCASNQTGADAYAALFLTSGQDVPDAPVVGSSDPVVSLPGSDTPADVMSAPAPTSVPDEVQALIDSIQQRVQEILDQIFASL